jgi:hypothetical protein
MTRALLALASCAALLLACTLASPPQAHAANGDSPRVYLVIATGLQWGDITATGTPTMHGLASSGAVGNLNARPRSRDGWEPVTALEGALGLSAGGWVVPDAQALSAFDASESVRQTSTPVLFRRLNGRSMDGHAIAYLGLMPVARLNATIGDKPVPGTLGRAIVEAGGVTVAIGNSDSGDSVTEQKYSRPAAVAAMDADGLVMLGDVSPSILASAPQWPYGVRTDVGAIDRALAACEASAAAHGGPTLIVLDPGDEYRARRYAWQVSDAVKATQRARAVRTIDEVTKLALSRLKQGDTLVVCTQAPSEAVPGLAGFSPLLVAGADLSGYLTSGSTHQPGTVSNPDITAFVLDRLRVDKPLGVIGSTLSASEAPPSAAERTAYLGERNETAASLDSIRGAFTDLYVKLLTGVMLLTGALLVVRARLSVRIRRASEGILKVLGLAAIAFPTAGLGMFVFARTLHSPAEAALWLVLTAMVLLACAMLVWRRFGDVAALAGLLLFTFALFLGDQLVGAPLSVTSLIGYTPLLAVRYYGIGNEAAAFMVGSAIMGIALVLDVARDARWAGVLKRVGIPVAWALTVIATAAPFLGANVGVAIWATGGFGVFWLLVNGRRVTWRWALAGMVAAALAIVVFAAADLFGGGEKTHLARSLTSAEEGGVSELWSIVTRKAQMNARILAQTSWTSILLAVVALMAFAGLRREGDLARVSAANPAFAAAAIGCGVAGALAFFSEDTGVMIPAFISVCVGVAAMWHLLSDVDADKERS